MADITVNGTRIAYTDTGGSSIPILLLHAFPLNSKMWEPQIEALGDRFRFIAPDLKGFGESDAPEDRSQYTMESYADEMKALLDELGLERVMLCGLSMGAYIALAFARRYPQRVAALVLADSRAEADTEEGRAKRSKQQAQVEAEGTAGLIDGLTKALLGEPTQQKKQDVVERVKQLMDNPAAGFIGALEAMKGRPDSTDALARLHVPSLVIVGENDAVTPPEASRKLHEHLGGSRLVVIPEAGHLSNLEAPEAFNGALAEFLRDL